jgi:hypothetical protein
MRAVLTMVALLVAGGCSSADRHAFATQFNPDALFGSDSEASFPPDQPLSNTKCRDLAFDRSSDVADQGFDESVRRVVSASTYADCVAWAARGTTVNAR